MLCKFSTTPVKQQIKRSETCLKSVLTHIRRFHTHNFTPYMHTFPIYSLIRTLIRPKNPSACGADFLKRRNAYPFVGMIDLCFMGGQEDGSRLTSCEGCSLNEAVS